MDISFETRVISFSSSEIDGDVGVMVSFRGKGKQDGFDRFVGGVTYPMTLILAPGARVKFIRGQYIAFNFIRDSKTKSE